VLINETTKTEQKQPASSSRHKGLQRDQLKRCHVLVRVLFSICGYTFAIELLFYAAFLNINVVVSQPHVDNALIRHVQCRRATRPFPFVPWPG